MTSLRVLIVDDEEPARNLLRAFLSDWSDAEIVGEAGDGDTAVKLIQRVRPDLVFLDVQMPVMGGFEVVAALAADETPLIVFVTAYDTYALRAFEVSACDYLLKPFDAPRLATTMKRVLDRGRSDAAMRSALHALAAHLDVSRLADGQVIVKVDGRHVFLNATEIEWIEAAGKDARLHLQGRDLAVRESLSSLERRLDPSVFVRVHRSAIVNRTRIREMQPWVKGDFVIIMRGGGKIITGRTHRDALRRLLGDAAR